MDLSQRDFAGFNVLLQATRPPYSGSTIQAVNEDITVSLTFGDLPTTRMRTERAVLDLIEGKIDVSESAAPCQFTPEFFKELVLAQDPLALDNESEEGLPSDWRQVVEQLCDEQTAGSWQREAIFHFFTHKFTLVAADIGKSTLVELLMILLERFEHKFWCCINSDDVRRAEEAFSTTGGATPLLHGSSRPDAIIMYDDSQAMEASCILPIVKGIETGRLKRVFVIGDPQQRPQPRHNTRNRNLAARNGEVPMLERLEAAGFPVVRPKVQ